MKEKLSQIQRMAAIVIGFELIVTIALGTVFKMTIWPMILVIVVEVV